MFRVLCDLAEHTDNGEITAIVGKDGDLSATHIVDGEEHNASGKVIDEAKDAEKGESTSDWRNNKYIS